MAARYFINGGVDNNWGTAGNWSATTGGAASGVAPIATDDVHLDANSPNCIVNASARVCLSLDFTGYGTRTITMSQQITVSSNVTLIPTMNIAGSGALIINGAGTLTSNGKTWPNPLLLVTASGAHALADIWNVNGLTTVGTGTSATIVNGFQINCAGGFAQGGTTSVVSGSTAIHITAACTIATTSGVGQLKLPIVINAPGGTITFPTGAWRYNTGSLTYVAGTVVASNTDLNVIVSTTFDTGGAAWVWRSATFVGSAMTHTFNSSLHMTGDLLLQATTTSVMTLNGASADIRFGGNLTITGTTAGTYVGTLRSIILAGTGTVSWASVTTGRVSVPMVIDAGAGTVTVTAPFPIDFAKLVYLSGTVTTTATWTTGGSTPTFPLASQVYAGVDRGDGTLGTLHASNIAAAAGSGVNLTPSILLAGNTVDNVIGTHTEPVVTFPAASKVYAGTNRGDGTIGTLHASNIAIAAGAGVNLTPSILLAGNMVDDVTGTHAEPVVTFPPASKVYAGANRGDGVLGTLHASNIAAAAGAGASLAAADLRSGVTVDDVSGALVPTGGVLAGGAYTFID
jgi:hypothetical protein